MDNRSELIFVFHCICSRILKQNWNACFYCTHLIISYCISEKFSFFSYYPTSQCAVVVFVSADYLLWGYRRCMRASTVMQSCMIMYRCCRKGSRFPFNANLRLYSRNNNITAHWWIISYDIPTTKICLCSFCYCAGVWCLRGEHIRSELRQVCGVRVV